MESNNFKNCMNCKLGIEPNRKIHHRFFSKTDSPTDSYRFCLYHVLNYEPNSESYDFDYRGL